MDTTLTIHVAGRADEISPKTMAKAFAAFADLLEAPDDGSHWTMVGAHLGSLTLEARPSARTAEEERAIFDTLVSGLSFFNESGEAPESWSPQGRAAVQTLRELTTAPGVEGITAAVPDQTIVFTPVDGASEHESRRRASIGSVTGVIDRINTRQGCEFGLIDEAERHPVKVLFSATQLDAIIPRPGLEDAPTPAQGRNRREAGPGATAGGAFRRARPPPERDERRGNRPGDEACLVGKPPRPRQPVIWLTPVFSCTRSAMARMAPLTLWRRPVSSSPALRRAASMCPCRR